MLLALKIDVDTLRGTREGVPDLVTLLRKHGADATFLFTLGPDHTGRAIKRSSGPAFSARCGARRSSGTTACKTLLYGTRAARARHRPARRRRDARDARRGLRDGHPHLGPRPLAGRRRERRRRMDASAKCSAPAIATPRSSERRR